MDINLDEKQCDEIFALIKDYLPEWEKLIENDKVKIKTYQKNVQFISIDRVLQKFDLKIINISFTDYYGIVFGIEKIKN